MEKRKISFQRLLVNKFTAKAQRCKVPPLRFSDLAVEYNQLNWISTIGKSIYIAVISFFFIATILGFSDRKDRKLDNFSVVLKDFANPPAEFRTAPFVVWNGKMTKPEIDRMLTELKDSGAGSAIIHPRPGLITEYLSDEWFDLYKYAIEKAKKLGLEIWIYDENSYPSGFAGGHVPAAMPESYNQGQGLKLTKANLLPENTNIYYLCLSKDGDAFKDITKDMLAYKNKEGNYYLYEKTYYGKSDWFGGWSYVDLLYAGVTEKFIHTTMDGYEKVAKNEFGKVLKGVITDEPNIESPGGLRWTPDLFEVFQKQYGYDLKSVLPLLEEETGNWKEVRNNYMSILLKLFIDRNAKPWFEYAAQNNLIRTGHYWEHEWPSFSQGPDNMAMYAWQQIPSIDLLFNQFDEVSPQAQYGNVRAVKELRSAANQTGARRTLCETYGGGGWEESFKDFKRLGDWQTVFGVNFMNQHLSHQTLSGSRKYDYPPVFTYHSPWWSHYKVLNDYFARLSLVLTKGEQLNDILVLEPTTTLWSYYSHTKGNAKLMEIGKEFQSFITKLEKKQVEYDIASEDIIKDKGSVYDNGFVVGQREYTTVILPPLTENIEQRTFELLQKFVEGGGTLITYSDIATVNGKESSVLKQWLQKNATKINRQTSAPDEKLYDKLGSRTIFKALSGGNLFHQRRIYEDGDLLFMVNSSMDEVSKANITMRGKNLLLLDVMTGKVYKYPSKNLGNDMLSADISIEPAGSMLVFSSMEIATFPVYKDVQTPSLVKSIDNIKVERIRDNALMIDFCDLKTNNKEFTEIHTSNASDLIFKEHGFKGNPWNTSVQYKRSIIDRDTFSTGGGTVRYKFNIDDKIDVQDLKVVIEHPELWKATINGNAIAAIKGEWWLDKSFGVYNIGNFVKTGTNVVEISISPMSIHAEIEPIYITGNFDVASAPKGWTIKQRQPSLSFGSWKNMGMPFYSWEMGYSKNYTITDTSKKYVVQLSKWNGTVSEVWVNGKQVDIIAFDPYKSDISKYLIKGKNKIEVRVIGSLKNLLGPHHNNPAPGLASPWHWKNITKYPEGKDYQMLDYGLFEDFKLMSN